MKTATFLLTLLLPLLAAAEQRWRQDLQELQALCNEGLISPQNCAAKQREILGLGQSTPTITAPADAGTHAPHTGRQLPHTAGRTTDQPAQTEQAQPNEPVKLRWPLVGAWQRVSSGDPARVYYHPDGSMEANLQSYTIPIHVWGSYEVSPITDTAGTLTIDVRKVVPMAAMKTGKTVGGFQMQGPGAMTNDLGETWERVY